MYAAATVILRMLGYKMNSSWKRQGNPPWKRRLENKITATRREVTLLTELQKGVKIRKKVPKG